MLIVDNPEIEFNYNRKDGISAMLRVRNGEDFLELSIMSIIDQVDEIICVFNDSQDNTEKILLKLENKYPEKIFVYKYSPIVYPPNSKKYMETSEKSPHSLCYYYNFALSKTTYSHVFKLDDDELFFPNSIRRLKKEVNDGCSFGFRGINLYDYKNKLFICGMTSGFDTMLFKFNNKCKFYKPKDAHYESFSLTNIKKINIIFYHLKYSKKDRGLNNYDIHLNENKDNVYYKMSIDILSKPYLDKFVLYDNSKYKNYFKFTPYSLGFKHINNSKKKYKLDSLNVLEKNIIL